MSGSTKAGFDGSGGDAMLSDAWGTQVRLRWEKDKLMVQSAGADRVWDTADDMTVERRLAD